MAKQAVEQFSRRYTNIAEMSARIPAAEVEERQQQEGALKAGAAAATARTSAIEHRAKP